MTKEPKQKQAQSVALVVTPPQQMTPDEFKMIDALAVRYARSELAPSWCRGKPDNIAIAMVNGHALGLHLAVAINSGFVVNGHYDLFGHAFLALAQGRDPLFRYAIEEWTDEKIKLVGWREGQEEKHTVELTRAQLARNPATAKNPSFASNPKDHLMWKASKRLVRLVTPAVTLGLPLPSEEQVEQEPAAPPAKDAEAEIETVIRPTGPTAPPPAAPPPAAAPAPVKPAPVAPFAGSLVALSSQIHEMYGPLSKAAALEKVSFLYSEMMRERTGIEKKYEFKRADAIGEEAADELWKWLATRQKKAGRGDDATEGAGDAAPTEAAGGTEPAPAREPEDEPPPAEDDAANQMPATFEGFMRLVQRARKLFDGRNFIKEAPPGSGKMWYVDQETFSKIGYNASVKVQDNGEVSLSESELGALAQVLSDACDAKERGRP